MRAARPSFFHGLAKLLVDDPHLGRGRVLVAHAREAEEIAGKFGAARVEDERPPHPEGGAEESGFEDDVVPRRRLAGRGRIGCGRTAGRPVVASEHERREIDFARQLQEPFQRGRPRIERRRPRLDAGDVFESARERLQQLRLFS
jgi:hypothetical protein